MHPPKGKIKDSAMSNKEREGRTKGKGGLNKKLQIPTLPPRSGVTFHCKVPRTFVYFQLFHEAQNIGTVFTLA